jgi:hypothetical protein
MPLLLTPLLVGFVVLLWTTGADAGLTARWSAVALVYFLFFSPFDCVVLDGYRLRCRSAASGLLRSCSSPQCRKKNRRRFMPPPPPGGGWLRARGMELVSSPRNVLTTFGAFVSMTSTVSALVRSVLPW